MKIYNYLYLSEHFVIVLNNCQTRCVWTRNSYYVKHNSLTHNHYYYDVYIVFTYGYIQFPLSPIHLNTPPHII